MYVFVFVVRHAQRSFFFLFFRRGARSGTVARESGLRDIARFFLAVESKSRDGRSFVFRVRELALGTAGDVVACFLPAAFLSSGSRHRRVRGLRGGARGARRGPRSARYRGGRPRPRGGAGFCRAIVRRAGRDVREPQRDGSVREKRQKRVPLLLFPRRRELSVVEGDFVAVFVFVFVAVFDASSRLVLAPRPLPFFVKRPELQKPRPRKVSRGPRRGDVRDVVDGARLELDDGARRQAARHARDDNDRGALGERTRTRRRKRRVAVFVAKSGFITDGVPRGRDARLDAHRAAPRVELVDVREDPRQV